MPTAEERRAIDRIHRQLIEAVTSLDGAEFTIEVDPETLRRDPDAYRLEIELRARAEFERRVRKAAR